MARIRDGVDPSIAYGTVFEGLQPGDVVKINPRGGAGYPAVIITMSAGEGRTVDSIVGTIDGVKKVNSSDLLKVKQTGDQKGVVARDLKTLSSEWKMNTRMVSGITKRLIPLIEQRAKTKLHVKSIEDEISAELSKL